MTKSKEKKPGIIIIDGNKYIRIDRTIAIFRRVREAERENYKLKQKLKDFLYKEIKHSAYLNG